MRRQALISLLCLLPLLVSCAPKESLPEPWEAQNAEPLHKQIYRHGEVAADIIIDTITFSGAGTAQQVNGQLTALWRQSLDQQAANAEQQLDDWEFNGSLPVGQGQVFYSQEEKPTVFFNDGRFLSVLMDGYIYTWGAAHPLTYRYAYVFDASSGQLLTLEDIWGENAREQAAAKIYAQIESDGWLDDFYPGLEENLFFAMGENNWYMDEQSVYISYNPYDIGPYALGIVEFTLPK